MQSSGVEGVAGAELEDLLGRCLPRREARLIQCWAQRVPGVMHLPYSEDEVGYDWAQKIEREVADDCGCQRPGSEPLGILLAGASASRYEDQCSSGDAHEANDEVEVEVAAYLASLAMKADENAGHRRRQPLPKACEARDDQAKHDPHERPHFHYFANSARNADMPQAAGALVEHRGAARAPPLACGFVLSRRLTAGAGPSLEDAEALL